MLDDLKSQIDTKLHTVRRFLERPIQVSNGNLVLGLSPGAQRVQQRQAQRLRERPMRHDLRDLFEQHPASRRLMRHLDLVSKTLDTKGIVAVEALPTRVLSQALSQLERLVWDWSPAGLAELRSRLAVTLKSRPPETEKESPSTDSLELDLLRHAEVSEVEHSAFEEMERSWTGRMASSGAAQ